MQHSRKIMLGCWTPFSWEEVDRVDRHGQIRERLAVDELTQAHREVFTPNSTRANPLPNERIQAFLPGVAPLAAVPHHAGNPLTSRPHSSAVSMNASTLPQGTSIGRTLEGPGMAPPPVE